MSYRVIWITAILCITSFVSFSQGEANFWYFSFQQGLNFNEDTVKKMKDGKLKTQYSATISNKNGELLFYTDGGRVWNKNHEIMKNGRWIVSDTTLPSYRWYDKYLNNYYKKPIIIPVNSGEGQYMVVTNVSTGDIRHIGFRIEYAMVNMKKANGKGAVTKKGKKLLSNGMVMYAAVKHSNGKDRWLITQPQDSNVFLSYRFTKDGIRNKDKPVISQADRNLVDTWLTNSISSGRPLSIMKASPSGRYLVTVKNGKDYDSSTNFLSLFKFKKRTGEVLFLDRFKINKWNIPLSIAFSSNERYLYISYKNAKKNDPAKLTRLPIIKPGACNTKTKFGNLEDLTGKKIKYTIPSFQVTPFGNIYYSELNDKIKSINNINRRRKKLKIGDKVLKYDTFSKKISIDRVYFPNFVHWLLPQHTFTVDPSCTGKGTLFHLQTAVFDSTKWIFGDGTVKSTSMHDITHIYSKAGFYKVKAVIYQNGKVDTALHPVCIKKSPDIQLGADTGICKGERLVLVPEDTEGISFKWKNGSTHKSKVVKNSGSYWVEADNGVCKSKDSINVFIKNAPEPGLINDTSLCPPENESIKLSVKNFNGKYQWFNGESGRKIKIKDTGSFYLTAKGENGCKNQDTVVVEDWCDPVLHVPNAFSPFSSPGLNDQFKPFTKYVKKYELSIYNRWGEKVFETNNPAEGWKGYYKNNPVESGVFIYQIFLEGKHKFKSRSGSLRLLR